MLEPRVTCRFHIFQTFVPFHGAQVFIQSRMSPLTKSDQTMYAYL